MKNKNFHPIGYDYSWYNNHMRNQYRALELDEQQSKGRNDENTCIKCALFLGAFALLGIVLSLVL